MKLILSRKGFDSSWGGYPSPILPDGRMVSLPIPQLGSGVGYGDIRVDDRFSCLDLMRQLGFSRLRRGGRKPLDLSQNTEAHLDPDLDATLRPRSAGWRPLSGQVDSALRHLETQGVGEGDIFLYFGWFRPVERTEHGLRYTGSPDGIHALFGFLEVGEVRNVDAETQLPWAADHPHLRCRTTAKWRRNCLFIAAGRCSLAESVPGAGVFRWDPRLQLTAPGRSRSVWRLPLAVHPRFTKRPLTHHASRQWEVHEDHVILHSAPIGQEFVVENNEGIERWLTGLLTGR